MVDERRVAQIARALAHPARVRIVRLLHERQACIGCDIVEDLGFAQSTVSGHLRILKEAGIVVGRIERPRVCYSLHPHAVAPLRRFLDMLGTPPSPTPARDEPCPSSSVT